MEALARFVILIMPLSEVLHAAVINGVSFDPFSFSDN
jgi:hypothetical protein